MKMRMNRGVVVLLSSATFWLCACQGELAVVEKLDDESSDLAVDEAGEGDPAPGATEDPITNDVPANPSEPAGVDGECVCARSPALMPLGCRFGEVPLVENDTVQTTADGSVVAFTVCARGGNLCSVLRWTGASDVSVLGAGILLGLSAAGDRVLTSGGGLGQGLERIDASGERVGTGLGMVSGRGALSASGEVVVASKFVDGVSYLARWSGGEVELIQDMGVGADSAYVTPDATAVVGSSTAGGYRWTLADGFVYGLPGVSGPVDSAPESISSDGSVVAGRSLLGDSHFRWTASGGFQVVASASGQSGTLLSSDGSVVAGSLVSADGAGRAFRWTEATGAQELTPVPTTLTDMNDDGSVIVATVIQGEVASDTWIWDETNGARRLPDVLDANGVDRSGWTFGRARVISGDGKVLLGIGTCGGASTLYRIVL